MGGLGGVVALGDAAPSQAETPGTPSLLQAPSVLAVARVPPPGPTFPSLCRDGAGPCPPPLGWNSHCVCCRAQMLTNLCFNLTNGQCLLIKASLLWLWATAGDGDTGPIRRWLCLEQPVTSWGGSGILSATSGLGTTGVEVGDPSWGRFGWSQGSLSPAQLQGATGAPGSPANGDRDPTARANQPPPLRPTRAPLLTPIGFFLLFWPKIEGRVPRSPLDLGVAWWGWHGGDGTAHPPPPHSPVAVVGTRSWLRVSMVGVG